MSERRAEPRRRTRYDGRLAMNQLTTLDCVVTDMSAHGSHLQCRNMSPHDFAILEIKAIPGFKRTARIIWRRLEDCGVEFV